MRTSNLVLPTLIAWSVFLLYDCNQSKICDDPTDPFCPNFDPCIEASRANAEFIIFDSMTVDVVNPQGLALEIDTMWSPRNIHFKALHENDTYEWRVGTDARTFTEKEFFLYFNDISGNIEVRLIVTKKDSDNCFMVPDSLTRDTFYKQFYLYHLFEDRDQIPIFGSYTGYDEDQPDSIYTMEIRFPDPMPGGIYGFPRNCTGRLGSSVSFRAFLLSTGEIDYCDNPKGYGILQEDNKTLIVEYNVGEVNGPRTHHKFIGIKN